MHKIILTVRIEASTEEIAEDMLEALSRAACDVANSTEDTDAHILIDMMD